ncbi:hypothetical protein ACSBR1_011667 [Camellia fascicularis]
MEQDGWIPVVKHPKRSDTWNKVGSNGLFSIFVDNLPFNMDPRALFKLFTNFGIVRDVFIPQKRRKATNSRFGFVRFDCLVAANVVVQKTDGLWVEDRELKVKMAEYGRFEIKTNLQNQLGRIINRITTRGRNAPDQYGFQRSFPDVLKTGVHNPVGKTAHTIQVDEEGHG